MREEVVKKHRKQWVKALRNGEYEQGKNNLRSELSPGIDSPVEYQYCCLGVACDLSRLSDWTINENGDWHYDGYYSYIGSDDVREYYGLASSVGSFYLDALPPALYRAVKSFVREEDIGDNTMTLVGLNDRGASFDLIADVIEEEPRGLFR